MIKISSEKMAPTLGPYSAGIATEQYVFLSGQLGMDESGNLVSDDVVEQTSQALKNIGLLLNEVGLKYSNIVKTTVFIKDMNDFSKVNEEYAKYFDGVCPARSCVEVSKLPKDAKVEIECIVVK